MLRWIPMTSCPRTYLVYIYTQPQVLYDGTLTFSFWLSCVICDAVCSAFCVLLLALRCLLPGRDHFSRFCVLCRVSFFILCQSHFYFVHNAAMYSTTVRTAVGCSACKSTVRSYVLVEKMAVRNEAVVLKNIESTAVRRTAVAVAQQ